MKAHKMLEMNRCEDDEPCHSTSTKSVLEYASKTTTELLRLLSQKILQEQHEECWLIRVELAKR